MTPNRMELDPMKQFQCKIGNIRKIFKIQNSYMPE